MNDELQLVGTCRSGWGARWVGLGLLQFGHFDEAAGFGGGDEGLAELEGFEVALAADAGFGVFDDVLEEVVGDGLGGVGDVEELAVDGLGLGVAEGLAGPGVEAEAVVVDEDEGAAFALE